MIRAIVTDIEGTTSDIRFVHNVLFPYARERLAGFVTAQQHAEPVRTILDNLRRDRLPAASTADLIATLFAFMDEDRKSTALKALQDHLARWLPQRRLYRPSLPGRAAGAGEVESTGH